MTALFVIAKTWKQPKSPSTIIKWLNKLWKWKLLSLTLCDPMDYTVHGILQARILEWVAIPFSRGLSQPRDQTQFSHIAGGFLTSWATREGQELDNSRKQQMLNSSVPFQDIFSSEKVQISIWVPNDFPSPNHYSWHHIRCWHHHRKFLLLFFVQI